MIRQGYILLLVVAAIWSGCANPGTNTPNDQSIPTAVKSEKLQTRLGTATNEFAKDSVLLSFTVINNADTVQRFCKWETPFEPRLGKYLDITDAQGNEVLFKGAMAKRVMPPPPESYIEVPAHDSVRTVFNVADNYSITAGQFTVKYTGGGVSGLEAGNEIKITVTGL